MYFKCIIFKVYNIQRKKKLDFGFCLKHITESTDDRINIDINVIMLLSPVLSLCPK